MNRYDIALGKKPAPKPDSITVTVPILRSPDISSNRTSYVDLNRMATGDGSEGNPLNYAQFNSGSTSLSISAPVTSGQTYSISLTEGTLGRYQGIGVGVANSAGIARIRVEPGA